MIRRVPRIREVSGPVRERRPVRSAREAEPGPLPPNCVARDSRRQPATRGSRMASAEGLTQVSRSRDQERRGRTERRGIRREQVLSRSSARTWGSYKRLSITYSTTCARCSEIETRVVRPATGRDTQGEGDQGHFRAFTGYFHESVAEPGCLESATWVVYAAARLHDRHDEAAKRARPQSMLPSDESQIPAAGRSGAPPNASSVTQVRSPTAETTGSEFQNALQDDLGCPASMPTSGASCEVVISRWEAISGAGATRTYSGLKNA